MKRIINFDELERELQPQRHGERFAAEMAQVGPRAGARKLGCRLTVVPPGKSAWPFHAHAVNEEMIIVIEGEGVLRLADGEQPLRAGDVVALPPGGMEAAHEIINRSARALKYWCISTMEEPDIGLYPDSGKFFVMAGAAPGGDKTLRTFSHIGRCADAVDYWEGEA